MNTKKICTVLSVILLLVLTSCSIFRREDTPETLEEKLAGNWNWLKTECCFTDMATTTPEDCDCSERIIFEKDRSFKKYKNSMMEMEGEYTISSGAGNIDRHGDMTFIDLGHSFPAIINIRGDTLIIDRSYMDLEKKFYLRD